MRKAGRGLLIVVGVKAEAVEPRPRGPVPAVKCWPGAIVDKVEAGVEFFVVGKGVGRFRVYLQQGVGEHRSGGQEEGVDAEFLFGGQAERHACTARRRRGISRGGEHHFSTCSG